MNRVRVLLLNAALGPLDYRAPKDAAVEPGSIVVAPLGPRQMIGVAWEPERLETEEVGDNRLRPLLHLRRSLLHSRLEVDLPQDPDAAGQEAVAKGKDAMDALIAGFPGETEEEFQHLLDFVREAQIDRAGCFAYSDVNGAAANELPGMLPMEVREERRARVRDLTDSARRVLGEEGPAALAAKARPLWSLLPEGALRMSFASSSMFSSSERTNATRSSSSSARANTAPRYGCSTR